jgi:hypothetical protein
LRFVLKDSVSRGPIKEPAIPPMIIPRQFAITPIGIKILLFEIVINVANRRKQGNHSIASVTLVAAV